MNKGKRRWNLDRGATEQERGENERGDGVDGTPSSIVKSFQLIPEKGKNGKLNGIIEATNSSTYD